MQEMWVRPLGQEDPLEEGMATHCSILACAIPWTEEPGGLQSLESQRVRHDIGAVTSRTPLGLSMAFRSLVKELFQSTWAAIMKMHRFRSRVRALRL